MRVSLRSTRTSGFVAGCRVTGMSDETNVDLEEEELPPVAGASILYLGPVAPHWEIRADYGEPQIIDDFRTRVNARLMLLPPHDPQFRRNRDRVNRDAEGERIEVHWDIDDAD